MTSLRSNLLAAAIASGLLFAGLSVTGSALSQSSAPTPAQRKELEAAREDLQRAAKRVAELSGRYGGQGVDFAHAIAARPLIGVLFAPDSDGGVRIAGITPDGAGAAAGLKTGDRLLRIDNKTIEGNAPDARVENARRMLQSIDENTAVVLRYARGDRETEVAVKPTMDRRIMVFGGDGKMMRLDGNASVRPSNSGNIEIETDRIDLQTLRDGHPLSGGDTPRVFVFSDNHAMDGEDGGTRVDRRVIRIDCKGDRDACRRQAEEQVKQRLPIDTGRPLSTQTHVFRFDCSTPGEDCGSQQRLSEAFRWNGLNLASLDAQLGRYFGTDNGVLVLSSGATLRQLQAGDVIQRMDGKAVNSPRTVMDTLRDKPEDSMVAVDYLRDRKTGNTQIKVPKAMLFPPMPPMPPAPPAPPRPPQPPAPPAPPSPPPPPPPRAS